VGNGGVSFGSFSTPTLYVNGVMTSTGTVTLSSNSTLSLNGSGHLTITTLGNDIVLNGKLVNNGLIDIK
jgi:hypothetical protein